VDVLNNTFATLINSRYYLHNIVVIDSIPLGINSLLLDSKVSLVELLTDLVSSNVADCTFLVNQSNQVRAYTTHRID